MAIRLKFIFYRFYWLFLLFGLATSIVFLALKKGPASLVVTVTGTFLSLFYFIQKQKLEELKFFREIFRECNARYDEMNEDINRIAASDTTLTESETEKLVDYFNLCGEEFLYFSLGYIDPNVWVAWENGMKDHLRSNKIREFWERERQSNSYYGLPI